MHATHHAAVAHLVTQHPAFGPLVERIGPPVIVVTPMEPYQALIRSVAHQQLHGNAARAILARFAALFGGASYPAPTVIDGVPDEALRGCGFSATKVAAIRDICAKTRDGLVPSATDSEAMDNATLIERLSAIRGVGRWTVEMMLISTLGRADVLPVDDFAVREGWRLVNRLDAQPKPRELATVGEAWAPYRSTAAWYLWRAADEGKKIKQST